MDNTPTTIRRIASEKNGHKNDDHPTRDRKKDTNNKKLKDAFGTSHVQSSTKKRKMCKKSSDLLNSTSGNVDIKKMRAKIAISMEINNCEGSLAELVSSGSMITDATVGDDTLKDSKSAKRQEKQIVNWARKILGAMMLVL